MDSSALDDHVCDKKHKQKVKKKQSLIYYIKSNTCSTSKGQEYLITQRTSKNSVQHMVVDESTLNNDILLAFDVVKSHLSFRSSIDLSKLFLYMFKDSKIASKFTLMKTKY